MNSLRIAVWHNLPSGGGKRALFDHVRGLVERGHYVESWCPSTADQAYLPLKQLCPEHILPFEWQPPKVAGRLFGRLRASWASCEGVASKLRAMDRHCQQCAQEIEKGQFDLVFANSCMFFRVPPIANHVDLPVALYLQEPYRWLYEALPTLPWAAVPRRDGSASRLNYLKNLLTDLPQVHGLRIQANEEVTNARAYDMILVNSLFSRESVLRAFGLDARVCYLGVDLDRFKPSGEPTERYVVNVGALYYGKGPERTIRALGTIDKARRPNLVWIGNFAEGGYEDEIRKLAAECGVHLDLKVNVSDAELVSLLSRAAAMIYTPRLEPFGYVPLEANACGVPVIAIAEGGIRETVQHGINGLLVNDADPVALGKAVETVLNNPDWIQKMRSGARSHVLANWDLAQGLDNLERHLAELMVLHGQHGWKQNRNSVNQCAPNPEVPTRFNGDTVTA
jgi:glycosyltransferase involved in cell wall biosynthesis